MHRIGISITILLGLLVGIRASNILDIDQIRSDAESIVASESLRSMHVEDMKQFISFESIASKEKHKDQCRACADWCAQRLPFYN